jgi:hypothetical protein
MASDYPPLISSSILFLYANISFFAFIVEIRTTPRKTDVYEDDEVTGN